MTATGAGQARKRIGAITLDQIVASVSNLLVLIWAAHALQPADFGRFSLVFLVYTLAQGGVIRSLVAVTIVVHPEDADSRPRAALGATMVMSAGVGACSLIAAGVLWAMGSPMASSLAVVGALTPLLALQDIGRFVAIARSTPVGALVLDGIWLVLTVLVFAGLAVTGDDTLFALVLGWAGTGAIAGLWVFVQYGVPRARELSLDWVKERWDFSWRSLVASSSSGLVAVIGSALLALVSGPVAVAQVRAALLLERPSTTVQTAVATSAGADIAREGADRATLLSHQRRTMSISAVVAILNIVVLLVIPDWAGKLLLGNVWHVVQPLLVLVGLRVLAFAAQSGVRAALVGRKQIKQVMVVDIVGTILMIVGMVVGGAIDDGYGAMAGGLIGQVITVVAWWVVFARYLRSDHADGAAVGAVPAGAHVGTPAPEEPGAEAVAGRHAAQ
ncbi:hypothetical protein [Nocardioides jejuensis]|uniref:Polysaccharide biosynthesis protein n=1 Tax=Nocardioides jejuensis TaxID=2502782 RepID=A0A4R1BVB3_9ACTN|nr:hypothetical protein [Nocardioides jejuensis]TCJ21923.1 hypothetical protein EPD65_14155 [Nocardioides jejuensis]